MYLVGNKLITFIVPCYNSAEYMDRCIMTLLTGGDAVEIIIVNDGSTDSTGTMADDYKARYPGIVRVIHQQNKGHGGAVNAGLANAAGKYFKVVDSDDWLDAGALAELIGQLKLWEQQNIVIDMLVCNYLYDHLNQKKQYQIHYRNVFRASTVYQWKDIGHFKPNQYLVMHSLVFRTEVLRISGVELPLHTFYVDNLFAYQPLPYVQTLYYLDIDLYHYYIGREDQSVNEQVLCRRIDQQITVTKLVSQCVKINDVESRQLADYMIRNISIMVAISSIHLLLIGTDEAMQKRSELWQFIRRYDDKLYRRLQYHTLCGLTYLPGKVGARITLGGYRVAKKLYKFQ